MRTSIAVTLTALAVTLVVTAMCKPAVSQSGTLIFCDRKVIRSVEEVQYDLAKLVVVLRKERAAGNCAVSVSFVTIKPSDVNKVSCSGNTCGMYIRADITNEVKRQ